MKVLQSWQSKPNKHYFPIKIFLNRSHIFIYHLLWLTVFSTEMICSKLYGFSSYHDSKVILLHDKIYQYSINLIKWSTKFHSTVIMCVQRLWSFIKIHKYNLCICNTSLAVPNGPSTAILKEMVLIFIISTCIICTYVCTNIYKYITKNMIFD